MRVEYLVEGVRVPGRGDISSTWEVWGRERGKGMVRKRWIIAWGWGRVGGLRILDKVRAGFGNGEGGG